MRPRYPFCVAGWPENVPELSLGSPSRKQYATRPRAMQRMTAVVVGALLLVMTGALVLKGGRRSFVTELPDAGAHDGGASSLGGEGGILDDPLFALDLDPDAGPRAAPVASSALD